MFDIETASKEDLKIKYAEYDRLARIYFIVVVFAAFIALISLWAIGDLDAQKDLPIQALIVLVPHESHLLGIMIFSIFVALLFVMLSFDLKQSSRIVKLVLITKPENKKKVKRR
jgi:cation transport ATPase